MQYKRLFYGVRNITMYLGLRADVNELIKEIIKTAPLTLPAHMWYLPALIGVLMISPVLRLIMIMENEQ